MAIPLLAAGTGPLANMLSIAGLVTSWRSVIPNNGAGRDQDSVGFPDPHWYFLARSWTPCLLLTGTGVLH